jgi:hypothetical protein
LGVLLALGIALAFVGGVDVALLFYPARFASLDWEFGTISGAVAGMPLVTVGCGAITAVLVARGWTIGRRVFGALLLLVALVLLLLLAVYGFDVPVALRATIDPARRRMLKMAVLKTVLMGVTYVLLYAMMAMRTWRRSHPKGA